MTGRSGSSIFESFNARALRPTEVAETFVPSDHYARLVKRGHSVLIGPRGSGKTTLLKMLQQPALAAWAHPLADKYRTLVDYTGVFIATDISWSAQIESLGENRLDSETHRVVSIAAFSAHVLRSMVVAMLNRIRPANGKNLSYRNLHLDSDQEAKIVQYIAQAWILSPQISSLLAVKQALRQRLLEIRVVANKEALLGKNGREMRLGELDYIHLHFREAVSAAIEIFNDVVGEEDAHWALLFDELELAPDWIQKELIQSLRSTDERILFKLALSPFSARARLGDSATSAASMQDFEQIPLWYASRVDGYKFCEELWHSMMRKRRGETALPRQVLGKSYFETDKSEWVRNGTAYRANSRLGRRFERLAKDDKSFSDFLAARGIGVGTLESVPKNLRDSVVRKIGPLIAVREYYRFKDEQGKRRRTTRSRKSAALYSGAASVFAITEGNPRWFIGMVGRILDRWPEGKSYIAASIQADELAKASQRFAAMLRTIPAPATGKNLKARGVLSLVRKVGDYFHEKTVLDDFIPEPHGSFTIDSHISENLLVVLEQALNAGAIVYLPEDEEQSVLTSLRGKRFRLSYLLAPLYGFPIRVGPAESLSTIFGEGGSDKERRANLSLELWDKSNE